MSRNLRLGASSIAFSKPLYIESAASIVSQKEADGPLGDFFDLVCEDPMFGCDTWESAESTLQKERILSNESKLCKVFIPWCFGQASFCGCLSFHLAVGLLG